MFKTIATLSVLISCFAFTDAAGSVVGWPSLAYDELEDLMVLNSGYNARNFPSPLVPCTFTRTPGQSIAGGFLRTAFHDMAAADVRAGTGGLDASIGFELDTSIYIENTGVGFNNTMTYYSRFFNSRTTMSDLIALGVYASVRACGGPAVPLKAGRIDATNAGPQAVPDPKDNTTKMIGEFARMGFSPQEMIQVVACGHTLGGVHSAQHPTMVLPNTTVLGVTDFDITNSTYDNRVVTEYLDGTTQNPLVVGPDVDSRSDLRVFSADGNKTVLSMANPSSYSTSCSKILAKMIDTVPAGVALTSAITPYDVKPYNIQLNVMGDDDLQFSGSIRFKTTSIPKSAISSIQLAYKDRGGADGGMIETTILGDASGFDDTFTFFGFNATISASTSISSFTVVAALSSGTVTYDNSQEGFPVQDTVFAQTLNSSLAASDTQGNQAATLVAAVRKGMTGPVELAFSLVQPMTYNTLPTISKSTSPMMKVCESKYYIFYSTTYSIPTAAINGTKYDVSVDGYSDSFKSLNLPIISNALSCQGSGDSRWNTTSITRSVGSTSIGNADTWTTTVVTALTTYCPHATEVVQGEKTYTVTQATTLLITDCPCTISWSSSETITNIGVGSTATTISNLAHAGVAVPTATSITSLPSFNAEQPTLSLWASSTTLPAVATYTGGASTLVLGRSLMTAFAVGLIIFL